MPTIVEKIAEIEAEVSRVSRALDSHPKFMSSCFAHTVMHAQH